LVEELVACLEVVRDASRDAEAEEEPVLGVGLRVIFREALRESPVELDSEVFSEALFRFPGRAVSVRWLALGLESETVVGNALLGETVVGSASLGETDFDGPGLESETVVDKALLGDTVFGNAVGETDFTEVTVLESFSGCVSEYGL
jgi:hypothetical protein